jgi:signal transduction histidine kinase
MTARASRRAEHIDLVVGIAKAVAEARELGPMLREVLAQLVSVLPASYASVSLVEGEDVVVRAAVGVEPPAHQARSDVTVPLRSQGRRIGFLRLLSTAVGGFGPAESQMVESVAAVLGAPIQLLAGHDAELGLRRELAEAVEAERRARSEAEAALAARDQFLSIASHELKTPLTPIKASAQLALRAIQQPEVDRARAARQLRMIDGQVDRLRVLVDDLLDTARIQTGRLELRADLVDLVDLVARVVSSWDEAHRARLTFEATQALIGSWDPFRIEQVVTNLVDNALKYSPAPRPVDLHLAAEGPWAVLRVVDRGIGVPEDMRNRIFEPFSRGAAAATRNHGGLGLGLFISRTIVERHGGTLELESHVGRGSTFIVRLPLEATLAAREEPPGR